MFRAFVVPSIVRRSACIAVRNYRRSGTRRPRDRAGVRIQYGIFNDIETLEEDPERTYDADFNRLDISHREHEEELALRKEQVKYFVIKKKYFKDQKMPNFLTWAEKEQIRHLHQSDPKEWTPERLAESFPAVEEIIVKIIKSKWTPADMQRVQKHDESVRKNWESFKANEIKDLDPDVCKHLKKFSNRNFDSIQNAFAQTKTDPFEFQFPKPKKTEFLSIITSCKRNDKKEQMIGQEERKQIEGSKENSLAIEKQNLMQLSMSNKQRKQTVTFNQLMKKTGIADDTDNEEMHLKVSLPEQDNLIKIDKNPTKTLIKHTSDDDNEIAAAENSRETETIDLTPVDANTTSKIIQKYSIKEGITENATLPTIRFEIKIPPKLRKKGSIYKLYDCFYNDHGKFMYRVPGLVD